MTRLFVIDDDPAMLTLVETVGRTLNWEVDGAGTLREAHKMLTEVGADLVVVDGMLPDGSGLEFVSAVVSKLEPLPKIVFLSAFFRDSESHAQLKTAGVTRILHKPLTPEALAAEFRSILPEGGPTPSFDAVLGPARAAYRSRLGEYADAIEEFRRDGDRDALLERVHRLAGTAGAYGELEISMVARRAENNLRGGEPLPGMSALEDLVRAMREACNDAPAASAHVPTLESSQWVLLLDDDPEMGPAFEGAFTPIGVRVTHATTLAEAMESLSESTPELVVVDYVLGADAGGLDALEALRVHIPPSTPVVVLSGNDAGSRRLEAAKAGAELYLDKGMGLEAIAKSLQGYFDEPKVGRLVVCGTEELRAAVSDAMGNRAGDILFVEEPDSLNDTLIGLDNLTAAVVGEHSAYSASEICRMVRTDPRLLQTPVMVATPTDGEHLSAAAVAGASEVLPFPLDEHAPLTILRTIRRARLQENLAQPHAAIKSRGAALKLRASDIRKFEGMVGSSPSMLEVFRRIQLAAPSRVTVLVTGESGTGKELVAHAIHNVSDRCDAPFLAVNCSAIPEGLLESELFGHVRGSFTGATSDKQGMFQAASGGTLFLDEIEDVSPALQVKLLRALESREVRRVGDATTKPIDVRIVAATNQNLERLVAARKVREDFYYRIRVFEVRLPPLRERPQDILPLVQHFIQRYAAEFGRTLKGVEPTARALLEAYRWPGNIRELRNVIEHAYVLAKDGEPLSARHLPPELGGEPGAEPELESFPTIADGEETEGDERAQIIAALERVQGNRTRAAKSLGYSRVTLWKKMRRLGLLD